LSPTIYSVATNKNRNFINKYLRLYRYIYKSNLRVFHGVWKSTYPEWNAAIAIPLVIFLNLTLVLIALNLNEIIDHYTRGEVAIVVLLLILVFINYLLFIRKGQY